jgi:putative cell wall-binding protein
MTAFGPRPIQHTIVGGFCQVCGELEEWLLSYGAEVTRPELTWGSHRYEIREDGRAEHMVAECEAC